MNCIFCKEASITSKSVEHIVPESLGNKSHILPKGVVCDSCNNYFALKVEKKVLDQSFFKNLRGRNSVPNKRGRIPPEETKLFPPNIDVQIIREKDKPIGFNIPSEYFHMIASGQVTTLILPVEGIHTPEREERTISRFLAKVGLELIASRFKTSELIEELIRDEQFDQIRKYARYDIGPTWPYHTRKIYDEYDPKFEHIAFEMDLLYTEKLELYSCIAISGYEFVLNIAGPSVDGYIDWLKNNNDVSPLHPPNGESMSTRPSGA